MKSVIFKNGIRLIYKRIEGSISSFSIGFEAGAMVEEEEHYGLAHVVEHMIYKGTRRYSEGEINDKIDSLFGMSNAMTNYPYVIFYGTCLNEDFKEGLSLHSDILQNPTFQHEGFTEEMNVIREELKEWREDSYQHCEDLCLSHGFKRRRIKELIIGNEKTLDNITLELVKDFHNKFYVADNCVISVVSSLDFKEVIEIVNHEFEGMNRGYCFKGNVNNKPNNNASCNEVNIPGIFQEDNRGNNTKVNIIYSIASLSEREILVLRVFNNIFGDGVSSILYNEIRTERGLSYEVGSKVKFEKGIKLFQIFLGTSKEKALDSVEVVLSVINNLKNFSIGISEYELKKAVRSMRLKLNIDLERSIVHSVRLCTWELMREVVYDKNVDIHEEKYRIVEDYNSPLYYDDFLDSITVEDVYTVIHKIFSEPTIEVLD